MEITDLFRGFYERHPFATFFAAAFLAIIGWLFLNTKIVDWLIASKHDARIVAAVIAAAGTAFGVMLSAGLAYFKSKMDDRKEMKRVATSLNVELFSQCSAVQNCADIALITANDDTVTLDQFESDLPPVPVVFLALADRITLLPAHVAASIVQFYGSLEMAKQAVARIPSPSYEGEHTLRQVPMPKHKHDNLVNAWRSTAYHAVAAMKGVAEIVGSPGASEKSTKRHADLLESLAAIALNGQSSRM
ncbi:MAG: hypothetical protein ABL907_24280 [Hyphomicrobium sp.]